MIHIQIDKEYESIVKPSELRQAAKEAGSSCGLPKDMDFTIVITGDDQIRSLNTKYRKVNAPTDVLSFHAGEIDPETGKDYLGDVIISYPRAVQQSHDADHATGVELSLLVIHGVLHLAGYDHVEAEEKRLMFALQNGILNRLNLSIKGFNA